jgi:hypothetical protein
VKAPVGISFSGLLFAERRIPTFWNEIQPVVNL